MSQKKNQMEKNAEQEMERGFIQFAEKVNKSRNHENSREASRSDNVAVEVPSRE